MYVNNGFVKYLYNSLLKTYLFITCLKSIELNYIEFFFSLILYYPGKSRLKAGFQTNPALCFTFVRHNIIVYTADIRTLSQVT